MKIIKLISILGVLAMTIALASGFINGDFFEDGAKIIANPWGIVSLVDLYVGFVLFSVWIVIRESNALAILVWVILMMILGFFTGAIYMLYAAIQSHDDLVVFMLGKKRAMALREN